MMRDRTSRPKVSVPRRWAWLGGMSTCLRSMLLGSYGASQWAKMDTTNSPKTRARPAMAMRLRFRCFQNSRCLIEYR